MNRFRECSSCGALYTKSCSCSKGDFVDKFVHDPNKTTDSSQKPPRDCPKCGNPVDGLYYRHCALLRKKLKEVWFTIGDEHKFFQGFLNTFESSNDDSNVVNAPQEPIVFNQDLDENSSQSPPHIDHQHSEGNLFEPSFDEEIISIKIDPHHFSDESDLIESLFIRDSLIISSSKIDSLLDEFTGELIFLKSIPLGINEADCDPEEEIRLIKKLLYDNSSPRPAKENNSKNSDVVIESFSPSPIPFEDSHPFMEEIDLFLTSDGSIPPGIDSDYSDSEGDNLFLERLLHDDPIPLPDNLDFSNVV
uniref:Reverse transcriptase domain-containing protein n=1 Tax=Tanacetum cinerariifolium TaxID=118510 RepID=A0A6L2KUX4_TANCI|nr:hypothetical protein [Tanacetum cinerariifolium]